MFTYLFSCCKRRRNPEHAPKWHATTHAITGYAKSDTNSLSIRIPTRRVRSSCIRYSQETSDDEQSP